MRFPYMAKPLRAPIYSLGPATQLHLPVIPVTLITPSGRRFIDGLIDSASTDAVFPVHVAAQVGIDLTNAPVGQGSQAGGSALAFRYAAVRLRIADAQEAYEWDAIVGFLNSPGKPYALLGHAGFLNFFDVQLRGAAKETIVDPNAAFPGQRIRSP
jgi:hypothetical protein